MIASAAGNLELTKLLIDFGADQTILDPQGNSAFSLALTSEKGPNIGLIDLLLENGANPITGKYIWKTDECDESERNRRRGAKHVRVVSGSNRTSEQSYSSLHLRRNIYFKSSQKHIDRGSKIITKSRVFENDAIAVAIRRGFESIAIKLLENLASWNKKCGNTGWTYLHLACVYRNWEVAKILIKKGCLPNFKGFEGKDAWACCPDEDAIQKLIQLDDSLRQNQNRQTQHPKSKIEISQWNTEESDFKKPNLAQNSRKLSHSSVQNPNTAVNLKSVKKNKLKEGSNQKKNKVKSPYVKYEIQKGIKTWNGQAQPEMSKKNKRNNRKKRKRQKKALKRAQKLKESKVNQKTKDSKNIEKIKPKNQQIKEKNEKVRFLIEKQNFRIFKEQIL